MFIIGIDIAKRSHEAVIVNDEGRIVEKSFSFTNSYAGYNTFLERVRKFTTHRD